MDISVRSRVGGLQRPLDAASPIYPGPTQAQWQNADTAPETDRDRERRVVIVSNRLPFSMSERDGRPTLQRSSGGLAAALRRIHERSATLWIGSLGAPALTDATARAMEERLDAAGAANVRLSDAEFAGFYRQFANGILWPTLHGMACPSATDHSGWEMYCTVNERFANAVASRWRNGDTIWIHDYQLMLLPALLRDRLPNARIGFFLHTPFPAVPELADLAEWKSLAAGMLGADVVGFQTARDARHFVEASGHAAAYDDRAVATLSAGGRRVSVIACPIGVDSGWFAARSRERAVAVARAALLRDTRGSARGPLFVGVDRLDYTKGISDRLLAFERLLQVEPELRGSARFVQVAVPSREDVGGYAEMRQRIEAIVDRINTRYATPTWTPVDYLYRCVDPHTLVALYRAADVMVVTPRRDGMNLVAKEFIAARTDGGGALVLTRTAGAAAELRAAVLVDPGDIDSILDGYRRALRMPVAEARSRMRRLRSIVSSRDVYAWADQFLDALRRPRAVERDR
jgi:trehalose 6-phosphate synthase/phosphatase